MLVAALLVIPAIVIEESSLPQPWPSIATVLNWLIWLAFATELIVMLAIVPNRWRWLRAHPLETAIVALTAPLLPAALQGLRVVRLARVLRILPIFRAAQISGGPLRPPRRGAVGDDRRDEPVDPR